MRWRLTWYPWGPLCCGLISALAAVYMMHLYIEQQLSQRDQLPNLQPPDTQQIELIVASQSLQLGDTLTLNNMSVRQVSPSGAAADTMHPSEANWLVGQRLAHPVQAGQPIQQLHLQGQQVTQFSSLLRSGQRALTLTVSAEQTHAGLVKVGDRVDFYDLSGPRPRLLDTEIEVIATGSKFISGSEPGAQDTGTMSFQSDDYRTLTFAIAAAQAPVYSMLQRSHQLAFWLRAPTDKLAVLMPEGHQQIEWIIGGRPAQIDQPGVEPSWL